MKNYPFILVLFLLFGCNEKISQNKAINIPVSLPSEEISLSSFVDSISYLVLDDTRKIDEIKAIKCDNDRIYCFTVNKVIEVFDKSGKYLFSIDKKGEGPGEYLYLSDFDITDKNIIILDQSLKRLIFYDLNGNYIKSKDLKIGSRHICALGDDQFWLYNQFLGAKTDYMAYSLNENYNLIKLKLDNDKDAVIGQAMPFPEYLRWANVTGNKNNFNSYEGKLYFCQPYDNTVYEINDQKVAPVYTFDFGEKQVPADLYNNVKYGTDIGKFVTDGNFVKGLISISIHKRFVIGSFGYGALYSTIYDKETSNSQTGYVLKNDIDSMQMRMSWYPTNDNNSLISVIESFSLMTEINRIEDSKGTLPNSYRLLKDQININSNPVLAFLHLKTGK